jgi:sugar phosphate isomerase/epimerase
MSNRRRFLQCAGAGSALAFAIARNGFAQEPTAKSVEAKSGNRPALPFELGIATYSFRKFPLDQTLAMSNRLGIKHLCLKSSHLPLDAKPEVIADTVAKAKAAGIDIYGCGVVYMSKPEEVTRTFEYAKAAGMRVIVGGPSPELLPMVNEAVKKYDIRVAIHNHGPGDKRYPQPRDAYEKIKTLDPRIGLCIDVGHTARGGENPGEVIEQFADRLYDVHMKDVFAATKEGDTIEMGRGVIDVPRMARALLKIRYSNIVSFEFDVSNADDPLPGLAESIGYFRGVLAAIS